MPPLFSFLIGIVADLRAMTAPAAAVLAARLGCDLPAALLEDAVAVGAAVLVAVAA